MIAEIKALDTLFFRDGKPFSRGEESWADGVFPPYPSVIYGALRTWFISNHAEPFSKTAIKESEGIKVKNIQYRIPEGIYLPMPLDLAEPKDKDGPQKRLEKLAKEYAVVRLQLQQMEGLISNYPCTTILMPPQGEIVETAEHGLIQHDDLKTYLNTTETHFKIRKIEDFAQTEPKTGIGRNDFTNTASDALLYRVGMRRATEFDILLDFDWPANENAPRQQAFFIKLGAENKVAEVRSSRQRIGINPDEIQLKGNRFKLYLSTPAIFEGGWQPDLSKHNVQANLVAAAVGKPVHIGGFDMEKNKPKTMYKAVPAGSVFFYETDEDIETVKEKLFGKTISDKMREQGFGTAYLGNWEMEK